MQTRLSTLHEKVLRHDYMKYASYVSSFWALRRSERERQRKGERPSRRNQKGIACIYAVCLEKKRREEEEEEEKKARQKNIKRRRERERERARQGFVQEAAYSGSSPRHHESGAR